MACSAPAVERTYLDSRMRVRRKSVKSLVRRLQEMEASVIRRISAMCRGAVFTVHDAVLADEPQSFDFAEAADRIIFGNA